jgi:uncharacterized protein YndB with AHSA1/START domain
MIAPMTDILHAFPIEASASAVFAAISTPAGLDEWWTASSAGVPRVGADYRLDFGPGYDWRATVIAVVPDRVFELEMTVAMDDWRGTRVRFDLEERAGATALRFGHLGWRGATDHYQTSSYCWAMYLRILKRYVEFGEHVPYERRLAV